MKLIGILICIIGLTGSYALVYSQQTKLNLNVQNMTVKNVLKQIEDQSEYTFMYNASKIDVYRQIDVNVEESSVEDILKIIFAGENISYKVMDRHIIISSSSEFSDFKSARQQLAVSGEVTDSSGLPIPGVSVIVKGTVLGTITGSDGRYALNNAPANAILVFSFIGMKSQEIPLGGRTTVNVIMDEETIGINEVVVTALGIRRSEKALSYNVQELGENEFLKIKDANVINSLNGKVAGVTINSSSSGVGGASKVVMRGTKGIEQSSNALYVIDGIPMYNMKSEGSTGFGSQGTTEAIADINPEDIETISVLTGAAAAALYGSQASNGAIVITTKNGQAGYTNVSVSSGVEVLSAFVSPKFQNTYGTGEDHTYVYTSDKSWGNKLNAANYYGYNPVDDYFQTGIIATETVSLSTGTDRNQTYLSSSAIDSRGIIPNNGYNRYNFTFRNTTSFLKDKMNLGVGASYIKQKDRNMTNQGVYSNPLLAAYIFPRGNDWEDVQMFERYNSARGIMTQYWPQGGGAYVTQNPYWINYRNLRENNRDRYMLNASLSYDIFDWLNVSGRVRIDNSVNEYTEKYYATTNTTLTGGSENGSYGVSTAKDKQTYSDVLVNIQKSYNDISIQANIGASITDIQYEYMGMGGAIRADGLPNVFNVFQLDDLTAGRSQNGWREQTQSVFGSVELGYHAAYYLTFTGRNDWPSQLAGPQSVKNSFFYPSVGGSVILSEIFEMPKQISYLKLRSSFASVGLPFARFIANPTYSWDGSNKVWSMQTNYPMYDLKPERTNSWEFGLTARFLGHFNVDLSYYDTKTYNQTFDPEISVSSGYSTLYVQTGSVRNYGVELALGYKNKWNDFSWSSNITLSANKNVILELVDDYVHPETGAVISKDRLNIGGLGSTRFILKKKGSLGDLYSVADLQRDSDGNIYVNKDGVVTAKYNVDDIYLGSVFPKCNTSWRNDLSWNNFNFSFMLSARLGGVVYSGTQAILDLYGVSETTETARDNGGVIVNGEDLIPAQNWYTIVGSQLGIPQYYTYSATNIRLQEASIGYTIPKKALGNVVEMSISLVGRNLYMIYNKAPFDPETVATTGTYYQGLDYFMMPSTRNIGLNVRFNF
ncbi:SusC/RagA family TonB-linked outer membrane protein [Gaoshiqia sp. Z1-71]|uniref:SusC/RagA family TonB-linked outer membrane protein n=1 Tax=Gaoshiqia hydrogeniformans TaxID=3290090 RepID=UPI003BF87197